MLNLNPWVILGVVGVFILSIGGASWLAYDRGRDDMKAAYTEQQLAKANAQIRETVTNTGIQHKADTDHQVGVQVVHDTTREIIHTVTLPAAADPFLPVGFVRLFDRAASRDAAADPYPGKSDAEPSDVRVSQAASLLVGDWADKYYICKKQVDDTRSLNPVLPQPPAEIHKSFWERISPF